MNLVDLLDTHRTGQRVKIFNTEEELSNYTCETKKFFPLDSAKQGGVLKYLLRHIFDPEDEDEDTLASLVTQVSNLEKIQNDIFTLLYLVSNWLNAIPKSLIETACRQVPFAVYKILEPHALEAAAHME